MKISRRSVRVIFKQMMNLFLMEFQIVEGKTFENGFILLGNNNRNEFSRLRVIFEY